MSAIRTLEPTLVWELFDDITRVPRPSKKEEKTLYKYDESGKLAEISNYNGSGALLNTETPKSGASDSSVCKHDAEGKLIERTLNGENGCCQWRIIYRYDAAGNVIEATKYETDIMIPRECVVYTIYYRK